MRYIPYILLATALSSYLFSQQVTRDGLVQEWLGSSGISRTGDVPYELQNDDTWQSTLGQSLTVKDGNANDSLMVTATSVTGGVAIAHTGSSGDVDLEGAAMRTTNAAGLQVTWDFWVMLGDLSTDAVIFETGGGTHGASITVGDGDVIGDDDAGEPDRRDDLRVVLGGSGTNARLILDMDLPNTVTSQFHHVAVVYDGQDLILYLDGLEAVRHATGSDQNRWQGTDPMGLLGRGGSAIGGDGSAGVRPFKDNFRGAKSLAAFRWYDRGLTAQEVYDNYRAEANLVISEHRLHHWKLDEAAGATEAADSVDDPIHLAITGAVPEAEGIIGNAYTFTQPGSLLIHTPSENFPLTRYSLSIWAKASALGQPTNSSIFNIGDAGQDYQIGISGDVYHYMGDSGTVAIGPVTTEWIHIALAQLGDQMQLFYDGKLVQTATRNDTLISRLQIGVNRAQNQSFSGLIDDVVMVTEPLLSNEVAAIHGLGRFSGIAFDDAKINEALSLAPGGMVEGVGVDNHIWLHASGLTGEQGSISGSIAGRDAIIVIGDDGTGLRYDGVPGEVPAIVLYSENPAVYGKDIAITPNTPTAQGSPTTYTISETLPDGLSFDTSTGVLSGAPTVLAAETTYQITATNASGDSAAFDLVISVTDQTPPVITLTGDPKVYIEKGSTYTDQGASATDNVDATVQVDTGGAVDTAVPGVYTLTYTASDAARNEAAPVTREVVVEDLGPIVSTIGELSVSVIQPDPYENDPGAETDSFPHAPIAYYSMGGHGRDTGPWGNDHHATLHGDPSFATETHDSKGQSVYLDRDGDYLSAPGLKGVQSNAPRTVSAWIKTDFAPGATDFNVSILSWGDNSAGQKWTFRVQTDNGIAGAIRVEINGGAIVGSTPVNDNAWHHVAAVLPTGGRTVSDIKLYVDGMEETPSHADTTAIDTGNTRDVWIGNDFSNRYFLGHLDDVAIFDLALTAAEIAAYHAATAPAVTDDVASIDTNVPGAQTITYTSTDGSNRTSTSTRTVNVHDVTFPTISLTPGTETVTLTVDEAWNPYTDVTASDNTDGVLQPSSALDLSPSLLRLHLSSRELAGSLQHGDPIAQWDDLSPHGHHVSQADATLQPLLNTGRTLTGGTLVADYAAEFSGTQGKDGWHYGYFEGVLPYDPAQFTAMVGGSGNGAFTPGSQEWTGDADDTNGAWDRAAAVAPWTHISNTSIHPQGIDAPANIDTPQHPVIRWVSDVDGSIALSGYFNNTSGGGDGTTGRIIHNGTEAYFAFTDGYRKDFVVTLDVATGDNIDFLVDSGPADDSGTDNTTFAVTIHQDPTFSEAPYPFVTFFSPDYLTRLDTLGLVGSPEVTAIFLAKRRNTARVLHLGAQSGEAGKVMGFVGDSSIRYSNGNAIFANNRIDDNTWHIASYLTDTANGYSDTDLYVDGAMATQTSSATSTFPLLLEETDVETLVGLGRSSSGALTDFFQGDIAEMIVLETRADAALLNAAHYFLTQKFGLTTGATKDNVATTYDTSATGTQTVTYYVSDAAGNSSSISRTIIVQGNNKPTIAVTGDNPIQTILGQAYTDPGATASDVEDGDISGSVQVDVSAVDTDQVGSYTVTYTVTDSGGKQATTTRTVQVIDRTSPVIQLVGEDTLTIGQGSTYTDPGVTITDNIDSAQDLNAALGHVPMDGLVLHLDATKITGLQDGDPVPVWQDLTHSQNDAYQDFQVDSRPTYIASTVEKSLPAVRFDGTDDFLKIDSILAGGTIGRTIFAVFRPDDAGNKYFFSLNSLSVQNAAGSSYNYILTPEIGLRVANNKMFVNDVLSTTEASIFGIGNAQDALISEARAWKNGAELESTSVSGNSLLDIPGDLSTIGGRSSNGSNIPGDAYEILVYNRLLDDDEIRVLQYHLQNKYSIAGSAGLVDTSTLGNQTVHYTVRDAAGNYATETRAVNVVVDTWSPVITLNDSANFEVVLNSTFTDPGAVVTDDVDNGLQATTVITDSNDQVVQTVDTSVDGATYTITYSATDTDGHTGTTTRTLTIIDADIVAPVITLTDRALLIHPAGQAFTDPGATVLDNVDGVMTATVNSDVDPDTPGTYTITYTAIDAAGNVATPVDRTVRVQDLSPVIVLQGETAQSLAQNVAWSEPGYRSIVLPAIPVVYLSFDQNLRDHATEDGAQDGAGNTTWSADTPMPSGHSLQFDGTNRVTLTGYKGILGSNARAVSVWLKADPAINNSSKEIAHWGKSGDLERFTLRVNNAANLNEFRTDVDNGSTYGTTNIIDNAWHHLVVSYPAGGTLTDAKLYVDGILQITTVGGLGATSPLNTGSNDDLRIGNTFNGLLDEFFLFDHELTTTQVAALHQPETPVVTASTDTVDTADVASIDITYSATHTYGDSTATRTVNILDTTPPVITLTGTHPQPWETGTPYVEPGASATDNVDGSVTVVNSLSFPEEGLIAQWKLDEELGTDAIDSSPNLQNGTILVGTTLGQTGVKDLAYSFDGVTGGVNLGDVGAMDSATTFTFSTWFNRRSEVASQTNHAVNAVLIAQSSAATNDNFEIGTTGTTVQIYMDTAGHDGTINIEAGIQNDTWHHLVYTYDTNDAEGKPARLYIDNVLVDARDDWTGALDNSGTSPISIGIARPTDEKWGMLDGLMDETILWDFALTPNQIHWLHHHNTLDVSTAGTKHNLSYTATDAAGNSSTVIREVIITDDLVPPTLSLTGGAVTISQGDTWTDPGFAANDAVDGNLTPLVVITGTVDTSTPGTYTLTYNVMDLSGNRAPELTRTVTVEASQGDNFTTWLTTTGLNALDTALQEKTADPDNDQISNLIEYAFGTDPTVSDAQTATVKITVENNQATLQFVRLKTAVDGNLTLTIQTTEDLSADNWTDHNVTFTPTTDQDGVPTNYERVEATLPAPTEAHQFLRIQVEL